MPAQDYSAWLSHPAQRNLAGALDALMIEQFDGRVHWHEQRESITDGVFDMRPLVGTDTMSNAAMGAPTLQAVIPGVEPLAHQIEVGDQIVQVKTPIIARVTVAMLAQVQDRLSLKSRTPMNFARRIARAKDELLLLQCTKSALKLTGAGEVSDMPPGSQWDITALGAVDPDILEAGIMVLAEMLAVKEVDLAEGKLYMAPAQYFTLLKNDKLVDANFSKDNGHYANAAVSVAWGMPIVMTNRLSQVVDDGMTPGTNGYIMGANYTTSALEAGQWALFAMGESIMCAQSIPLTSDVYWDQRLLTWFIDSYLAFGAAPDRPDKTAILVTTPIL